MFKLQKLCRTFFIAAVLLLLTAGVSSAAVFYLRADTFIKTMPDGTNVVMWGFAQDTAFGAMNGTITSPGPVLTVPPGDQTLTIYLDNNLPEPVSLVIPGQIAAMTPVKFTDASGRQRVKSFAKETQPGNTVAVAYTWTNLSSGTYLYQSGTHPSVHLQMGLYGALKADENAGQAYPGLAYDIDAVLLFSEIDPAVHAAVSTGNYGPGKAMTSTVNYAPKYFLVNGKPYSAAVPPVPAGNPGDAVLLRFLNAGLKTHVPALLGASMTIHAEDGKQPPYPKRDQYSVVLPAGKTLDALISPSAAGYLPVYDRALSLSNAASSKGGMLAYLSIASAPTSSNQLSVTLSGTGTGTVTSIPGGINCGADCSETYNSGPTVTLAATPAPGSFFAGWTGGCAGTGECALTMDSAASVDAQFTAYAGPVLISPVGGEVMAAGSKFNIRWGAPATVASLKLEYSIDNGVTWKRTGKKNVTGSNYFWTVPRLLSNYKNCLVRVTGYDAAGTATGTSVSPAVFTIAGVQLTAPNGGETLTGGSTASITWSTFATAKRVSRVRLTYTSDGGATWNNIAVLTGNTGGYNWTVPALPAASGNCKVRVVLKDRNGNTIGWDDSDAVFTIQ